MRYFVKQRGGRERGPWSPRELRAKLKAGDIDRDVQLRAQGTDGWVPLDDVLERDDARSREATDDAMYAARRRSNQLLITGGAMLVLGLAGTLASLVALVAGGVAIVFVGLIIGGLVQINRGWNARP
jgi:hypothetical protein